jgi:prepilin-type N-terminal cleavage/methylation domain-containing protein
MKKNSVAAFTLIELLVVISIIAVLAGIALPVYTTVQERGAQTKDLSNAKQIALACKLYAADNDGKFPDKDGQAADPPVTALTATSTSNQAFACLVPNYLPSEKLFQVAKSNWSKKTPDEKMTASTDRCEAGTNNYAYELGLTDTSNPSFPLVADAPNTGGASAVYSTDPTANGGVWKGKKAIVIRCDMSGAVENCTSTGTTTSIVKGQVGSGTPDDIFKPATTWLSATNSLLLPAP